MMVFRGLMILAIGTALACGAVPAAAQSSPTTDPLSTAVRNTFEQPLEVIVTPYAWALSLNGNATTRGIKADINVNFNDILDHLNGAVMLEAEIRKGDVGLLFDTLYANLGDDDADGDERIKLDAEANQVILQLAGTYRLGDWTLGSSPEAGRFAVTLDPYAGARYTYLDVDLQGRLDLPELGIRRTRSVDDNQSWTDPIIGLRTIWSLGDRFGITLAGDVGGTSTSSQYSWQTFGVAGYLFSLFGQNNARLLAGYRALHQKYEDGSGGDEFEWDVTMHGPLLGLSINF